MTAAHFRRILTVDERPRPGMRSSHLAVGHRERLVSFCVHHRPSPAAAGPGRGPGDRPSRVRHRVRPHRCAWRRTLHRVRAHCSGCVHRHRRHRTHSAGVLISLCCQRHTDEHARGNDRKNSVAHCVLLPLTSLRARAWPTSVRGASDVPTFSHYATTETQEHRGVSVTSVPLW